VRQQRGASGFSFSSVPAKIDLRKKRKRFTGKIIYNIIVKKESFTPWFMNKF
jgi:hypothetical protein